MKKEPDVLCFISFCIIISLQEINKCLEMSPSFPRKNLLCICHHPAPWDTPAKKEKSRGCF